MLKFLRDKLISIGRDDEGAAFVITIAVFMFIYLGICGVFAVGKEIKEKIQLQNVADAAAYSAAVVQADTLSRIATLNRAMSWTYVQMTRRQMDYIVYTWLKHTKKHYDIDAAAAKAWALAGSPCESHVLDWGISDITINGSQPLPDDFDGTLDSFANGLGDESFYAMQGSGINKLKAQIQADKTTVREMNDAVRHLANGIKDAVDDAVEDVLRANVPRNDHVKCRFLVRQSENPLADYFEGLKNTQEDESRFLGFSKNGSPAEAFKDGTDIWFVRGYERKEDGGDGIRRSYNHADRGNLVSEWSWHSTKWTCGRRRTSWWHIPSPLTTCKHSHQNDACTKIGSLGTTVTMAAKCYGDNSEIYDRDYFVGEVADPLVLKKSYFSRASTITVGLARYNENPFAKIFAGDPSTVGGRIVSGLFAAFNPFNEWSWAFSSAKAGYLQLGQEFDDNGAPSRKYKIDWDGDDQTWNLCQSEWDAVFVPVRQAKSKAVDGSWDGNDFSILEDMVYSGNWKWLGDSKDKPSYQEWANVYAGVEEDIADGSQYIQGWASVKNPPTGYRTVQRMTPSYKTGVVQAQWNVQNRGHSINWRELVNRMFH